MKSTAVAAVLVSLLHSPTADCQILPEIGAFVETVCGTVDITGSVTREQITGALKGDVKGIARALGASVGADGKVAITKEIWTNLSIDDLPQQLKDTQECKERLSRVLIRAAEKEGKASPSNVAGTASTSAPSSPAIGVSEGPVEINYGTSNQ